MTAMSAEVILRLRDELTGPARAIQSTIKGIKKDLEGLNRMTGRSSGAKQFDGLVKGMRQAQQAAQKLRQTMARPVSAGFVKPATAGIRNFTSAADRATHAIVRMNRAMHRTPSGMGRPGSSSSRSMRIGGGGHSSGRHWGLRHTVGHAFAAAGVYEAVHRGIHGIATGVKGGFEQAFDLQHTKAMLRIQGESKDQVDQVVQRARQMAQDIPSFTTAQHAHAISELRPAMVGGIKEAMHLAPQFQKAVAVLESVKSQGGHAGLKGIDSHGEALDLARALELKGVMGDGDRSINSYMNGMVKAITAFNGQINAGDFHAAMKFGRGATRGWSEKFVSEFLPTIMNDLKAKGGSASGAGNALASFSRTIVDRVMKGAAMDEWNKLGLVDKKKIEWGKSGHIKNIGVGGISGWDKALENPYEYMQNTLLPAINAKFRKQNGGKDANEKQVIGELGTLFGNRIAQMLATIMTVQKKQIEKDAQNVRDAMGLDGLQKLQKMDSTARMQVLSASLKELGGALGEIGMPGVMRGMKGVIDWAHGLTSSINKSSYAKALGSRFDAAVAGIFGQRMGRGQFANGRNKEYWNSGNFLGTGLGQLGSAAGGAFKRFEQTGAINGALYALGGAARTAAFALNHMNGYAIGLGSVLNQVFDLDR